MEILQDLNTRWKDSKYTTLSKKNLPNKKNDTDFTSLNVKFCQNCIQNCDDYKESYQQLSQ